MVHTEPRASYAWALGSGGGRIYKAIIDGCSYMSWDIYACYADHTRTTLVPDGCKCNYTAADFVEFFSAMGLEQV